MYASGSTVEFGVKGTVRPDGKVQIGCKVFDQDEINEVASDLRVESPPVELTEGLILRAEKPHHEYGEFFLVTTPSPSFGHDDEPVLWSLKSGAYANRNYWKQYVGDLVPIYQPGERYTDTCSDRQRNRS